MKPEEGLAIGVVFIAGIHLWSKMKKSSDNDRIWSDMDRLGAARMLMSEDSRPMMWPYFLVTLQNAATYYKRSPFQVLTRVKGKQTGGFGKQSDGRWAGSSKDATLDSQRAVNSFLDDPSYSEEARDLIKDSISFGEGESFQVKLIANNPELEHVYSVPGTEWFFLRDKRRDA